MRHQLTENTKLLHKVVLTHKKDVLILKRSQSAKTRPGSWDLPGGNSEWPENDRAGHGVHKLDIAREIFEETGITVGPDDFGVDSHSLVYFDTYFDADKQVFSVICGWTYQLPDSFDKNDIKISHEHTEAVWIDPKHVDEYDFDSKRGEFIKKIIKKATNLSQSDWSES